MDDSALQSSFVLAAIVKWGAARMRSLVREWRSVKTFANSSGYGAFLARGVPLSGRFTQLYVRSRDVRSREQFKRRHRGREIPAGSAQGSTAAGGVGSLLRTLGRVLLFPIDVSSVAAKSATKRMKRRPKHHEPFTARAALKLCRLARMGPTFAVRQRAAGFYACAVNALRHKSATRFRIGSRPGRFDRGTIHSSSGGFVRGIVLTDPKTSVDSGIPSVCPANDLEGSDAWVDVLCRVQDSMGVKCVVYDDDSPSGDPFEAHHVKDAPSSRGRSKIALDSLLMSSVCEPVFTREELADRTPHCLKGLVPTVSRNGGDPPSDTNEIGKWDGSSAQEFVDPLAEGRTRLNARGEEEFSILETYVSAGTNAELVPEIMERNVERMRAHVRDVGDRGLPSIGGFIYYRGS